MHSEHAEDVRRACAALVAYIPDRLVREQFATPQPGRVRGAFWQGSLLFADLSGFTALSEKLSVLGKQGAEEISAVINQLFRALVAEVYAHGGMLLKLGGDALTAFFDADLLGAAHAAAAAHAALAMQRSMASFAALPTRAGTFRLRLRVGVHSGRVFAAEVGDESHIELVVTGPEVNRVALAQEIAAPGEVVISDATLALLEGASISPRKDGFQQIVALPTVTLPASHSSDTSRGFSLELPTPQQLDDRVAALRPYLVRGLPQRFLELSSAEQGEFRPVTVLFVNFHDFSALLVALGDDVARATAVLNAYFRRAQAVVHRYEGIVNKIDMYTHGDKLMVLFGAPGVHEDDPLRAVRCALELEEALNEANEEIAALLESSGQEPRAFALRQRIGINTGTVFAGCIGGTHRYEYTVMGATVNLAARLMSAADDGTILLSPATRAAVAQQVKLVDHSPLQLKGLSAAIVPARAVQVISTDMNVSQSLLVGRDAELEQLLRAASAALRGSGRVLALVGDAGIGKTRLSETVVQRLVLASLQPDSAEAVPGFMIYASSCQSYEQRTPYSAIRTPLRHLLRLQGKESSTPERLTAWCSARVEQLAPQIVRFAPLLADALGLPLQDTPLTLGLSPELRHDRLHELLSALLLGAAAREPLVLMLDDIHWADAASLELLAHLAQRLADAPLLLLLTYRPEPPIAEPWAEQAATLRLALRELSPRSCQSLLSVLLSGSPPGELLTLLERTQGNPLFIEELVRALIDSGILVRSADKRWHLARPLEQVTVPNSIEGLLLARLDRLEEQQHELVQVASVIGRRFERSLLERVYRTLPQVDSQIERLTSADIITTEEQETQQADAPAYLFRHGLMRDVAYESILYARRRSLHRQVARCLEELNAARLDEYLALIAQHYLLAEDWPQAFDYHLAAGIQAQNRYAHRDALALFQSALSVVPHLEQPEQEQPGGGHLFRVLEVLERSGETCVLLGEYERAQATYQQALEHVQQAGDAPMTAAIIRLHRLIAVVQERRADYGQALMWLEDGMAQASHDLSTEALLERGRCFLLGAGIYQRQGQYARSLEWARQALQIIEAQDSRRDLAHAYYTLGGTYGKLGRTQEAISAIETSLRLYKELEYLPGQADAHNNLANVLAAGAGRLQEAIQEGQAALELKEAIGDLHGQAILANNLGDLRRQAGDYASALGYFETALNLFRQFGSRYGMAVLHMNMGAASLEQGAPEEARAHLEQSKQMFEQMGTAEFLPELYGLYARLAMAQQQQQQALAWIDEALSLARRLDARSEEGEARRVRGLILRALDRRAEALAEMRQACAIFAEMDNASASVRCMEDLAQMTGDEHESGDSTGAEGA